MTIYMDLVMGLNFLIDLLLLLAANQLSGFPPGLKRCVLAAFLGAVYSGVCLLPGFRFLGNVLWRLVALGSMAVLAFGMDRSAVRRGGMFVILSMALGGIALCVESGAFFSLVLCAVILWGLCRIGFADVVGSREYVPVTISSGSRKVNVIALRDTGNTLRDPITGEQVLVVASDIAQKLTGLTKAQLCAPLETITSRALPGLRLIPYQSISSGGMLLAMRFEDVLIGNCRQSAVIAFACEEFGRGESYQALTGGVL